MRRFRFSLEVALNVRDRAVEAAENAVRQVHGELLENQNRQRQLADEVRAEEESVRAAPVNPDDFAALGRYRMSARRQALRLSREAAAIQNRLAEKQQVLLKAERDRTLLVRLKEKAQSRWDQEFEKEQQQLAEEAYLSRWHTTHG
jgi:hypothetical protein